MNKNNIKDINTYKHRLTAFVNPVLATRVKVRGALEGLTISEVVAKALDAYAPKIEKNFDMRLHIIFDKFPVVGNTIRESVCACTQERSKNK